MRLVRFRRYLDDDNAIRVRFRAPPRIVLNFMVPLECHFESSEEWIPIMRYDTAHCFVHYDIVHPYEATNLNILDRHVSEDKPVVFAPVPLAKQIGVEV